MKTKNVVFVGVAVFAISLLLISPVLANEDDFVLGIYGNANEDDTIDMRDFTYTARIILLYEDETTLADANYDERVSVADMTQIGLIILGREKELTVIDILDRTVTLNMPIERVVVTEDKIGEVIRILELEDTVVGIDPNMAELDDFFPVMEDKPPVGNCKNGELDYELIAELEPDLVIILGYYGKCSATIGPLERIGTKVIAVQNFFGSGAEGEPMDGRDIDLTADNLVQCFRTLGIIFNRDKKAQEFLDWRINTLETIMERTEDLEEDEIRDAFFAFVFRGRAYRSIGDGRKEDITMDMAGLHNIDEEYGMHDIDPEYILDQDPDIIFITGYSSYTGDYTVTEPSDLEENIKTLSEMREFKPTTAVKNGDVYVISGECTDIRPWIGAAYMGKVAYPDRFVDINPDEIAKEYFEEWVRVPYKGIFFYPKPWET